MTTPGHNRLADLAERVRVANAAMHTASRQCLSLKSQLGYLRPTILFRKSTAAWIRPLARSQ